MILVKLHEHTAETNRAWVKFNNLYGDIAYFSDLSDRAADEAINSIRDTFEDLLGLEKKLISMQESCNLWAKTVSEDLIRRHRLLLTIVSLILR